MEYFSNKETEAAERLLCILKETAGPLNGPVKRAYEKLRSLYDTYGYREKISESITMLPPNTNWTVEQCLAYCLTEQSKYADVIVLGVDNETGNTILRSSRISRAEAVFILMDGIDNARDRG